MTCVPVARVAPEVGIEVFAIGSPLGSGLEFSVSKGIVSGARRVDDMRFLQTDASVNPGNSGGPLLDLAGEVVAIISWKIAAQGLEGLGFGVPVDAVVERLKIVMDGVAPTEAPLVPPLSDKADAARLVITYPAPTGRRR
jgi:S1-C subfamily serine protease